MVTTEAEADVEVVDDQHEPAVVGGLDENVVGALSYALWFITGVLFYLIEDDNEFVRFHAVQSTIFFGGLVVLAVVGGMLSPGLNLSLLIIGPVSVTLWPIMLFRAYTGELYKLPVAGAIAEKYA